MYSEATYNTVSMVACETPINWCISIVWVVILLTTEANMSQLNQYILRLHNGGKQEVNKLKNISPQELAEYPNNLFKLLISKGKGIKEKYDSLRELLVMQTLPKQSVAMTNGLELFM
jgi:hypothetical protein